MEILSLEHKVADNKLQKQAHGAHNCSSSAARAASNGGGSVSNDVDADADGRAALGVANRLRNDEGSKLGVEDDCTDADEDDANKQDETDDTEDTAGATSNVLVAFDDAAETGGEENKGNDDVIVAAPVDVDDCASAGANAGSGATSVAGDVASADRDARFCRLL